MLNHPIVNAKRAGFVLAAEDYESAANCLEIYEKVMSIAKAIDAPVLDFRPNDTLGEPGLRIETLTNEISRLQRSTLIVAGHLLESAVTQIAILSLLDGYDVYICVDLVVTEEPTHTKVFLNRIRDCAGQTITSRQLVRELLTQTRDDTSHDMLKSILQDSVSEAGSVRKQDRF